MSDFTDSDYETAFSKADVKRLNRAAVVLGIKPAEFIIFATRHGLDELDALEREAAAIRQYYAQHQREEPPQWLQSHS